MFVKLQPTRYPRRILNDSLFKFSFNNFQLSVYAFKLNSLMCNIGSSFLYTTQYSVFQPNALFKVLFNMYAAVENAFRDSFNRRFKLIQKHLALNSKVRPNLSTPPFYYFVSVVEALKIMPSLLHISCSPPSYLIMLSVRLNPASLLLQRYFTTALNQVFTSRITLRIIVKIIYLSRVFTKNTKLNLLC